MTVIDADTSGPDNRPTGEAPQTFSANTDENGEAIVTVLLSMQPGNNYRAGASCLQDAINQADQATADLLNVQGGGSPGYSVPLVWSEMLTVWRKLWVEADSLAAVDLSNAQTGTIPAAPTFNPATNKAMIPIMPLEPDFEAPDQHKVGRIDILTYGSFTTISTVHRPDRTARRITGMIDQPSSPTPDQAHAVRPIVRRH